MKKLFLFSITLLLLYPLALTLPVQAESSENVTKRRPDRPVEYSPSPSPTIQSVDVKQLETKKPSFFAKVWAWLKTLFTN